MAKLGIQRADHEGPLDFLRRIERERPDLAAPAGAVIALYIQLRYAPADVTTPDNLQLLRESVANIRTAPI